MVNEDKKELSVEELADRWGVTTKTIYNRRALGTLPPAVNVGRIRFKMEDVLEFEQENP